MKSEDADSRYLDKAVQLALEAEAAGNVPVASIVVLDGRIISTGINRILEEGHPGRHAEIEALHKISAEVIGRASEMTCYTTLEPCLMCFGTLVLYGIGRVVFGASDPVGGVVGLVPHLPDFVKTQAESMDWTGPAATEGCDALCERVLLTLVPESNRR